MKSVKTSQVVKYDCAFVGTGVISILEAIAQFNRGKSVLMIDNKKSIGGAWTPIDVFGYKDVENAIHYFLPDKAAEKYMREIFGWNIFVSNKKFQLRKLSLLGYKKFNYDGLTNRLIRIVQKKEAKFQKKVVDIIQFLINKIRGNFQSSFYIKGGAKEILDYASEKLFASSVETKFNNKIEEIYLDVESNQVELHTDKEIFYAKKIYLTHGSRIKSISNKNGPIKIIEKILPRPSAHILINDNSASDFSELILDSSFVKYIHDVTHMIKESEDPVGKKLFIFGLGHGVKFHNEIYTELLIYMKKRKLISKSASFVGGHWTDVILPTISDADLYKIKNGNESLVEILRTENFSKAIGLYASNWGL